ncbi:MAG: hypothetical protein IJ300_04545 [Clostridia bacterium]|nr:hypothetical protein [Clostridia bacterium]
MQKKWNVLLRRIKWIFAKSSVMTLGIEHFFAMIPATILVPVLVNNSLGMTVVDLSLVLFTSGIGTIIFIIISKGEIPAYLGSSFAYIGLTIYLIETQVSTGISPSMAYLYVGWAYVFSGMVLFLLSFLYRKQGIDKLLSFLMPAAVVGPAISLIGLELADTAIVDAGFDVSAGIVDKNAAIVAIVTLSVIILCSLIKRRIFKNAAIFIGMLVGCIVSFYINGFSGIDINSAGLIVVPRFQFPLRIFPPNLIGLFIAVLPATFILFTENIGRVAVITRLKNDEQSEQSLFNPYSVKAFGKALRTHGIALISSAVMGSVPNTIYAENIAVMGIHRTEQKNDPDKFVESLTNPFSVVPYIVAAILAILFSFVGVMQNVLLNIPKAVIGGMELFLFGIISAPGIQMIVEQRVNYEKISNQIITAAVLISGVSGLTIKIGLVELTGMSLGFVVGVLLNMIVQFLKWLGCISDSININEFLEECIPTILLLDKDVKIIEMQTILNEIDDKNSSVKFNNILLSNLYDVLRGNCTQISVDSIIVPADYIRDNMRHLTCVTIGRQDSVYLTIRKTANGLYVIVEEKLLKRDFISQWLNDYPEFIDSTNSQLNISIGTGIPMRKIQELIKNVSLKE